MDQIRRLSRKPLRMIVALGMFLTVLSAVKVVMADQPVGCCANEACDVLNDAPFEHCDPGEAADKRCNEIEPIFPKCCDFGPEGCPANPAT